MSESIKLNKVCTNFEQDFTDIEKAMGRHNIDAVTLSINNNSVSSVDLTDNIINIDNVTAGIIVPCPASSDTFLHNGDNGLEWVYNNSQELYLVRYGEATYQEIVNLVDTNKTVAVVDNTNQIMGLYKYYTEYLIVFDRFYAHPQRGIEIRVDTSNNWSIVTVYPTDLTVQQVYTRDNSGSNRIQSSLLEYNPDSYLNSTPWVNIQGLDVNQPIWSRFVADRPEVVRFDYSSDMAVEFDTDPGSGIITLELQLAWSYRPNGSGDYYTSICQWSPKQVITLRNITQNELTNNYLSDYNHIEYSTTFDRERFQDFVDNNSNYIDCYFTLAAKVNHLSGYSSYSWLNQTAAHQQYTFWKH